MKHLACRHGLPLGAMGLSLVALLIGLASPVTAAGRHLYVHLHGDAV